MADLRNCDAVDANSILVLILVIVDYGGSAEGCVASSDTSDVLF